MKLTSGSKTGPSTHPVPLTDPLLGNCSTDTLTSSGDVSMKTTSPHPSPSLMTHIYVLYSVVALLAASLVGTVWLGSCRLASLQLELQGKFSIKEWAMMYNSFARVHNDSDDFGSQHAVNEDFLELWFEMPKKDLGEQGGADMAGGEDLQRTRSRSRRDAEPDHSVDNPDDWVWMRSFSRIPLRALEGYCREASLYCAAEGQAGPPGKPGEKGDSGSPGVPGASGAKGQKGAPSDPLLVAQNLGSMDNMRGPPGPKGDRGEKGEPGERGNMGPPGPNGRPGMPGLDGTKGEPGPQGPPGERGYNGANGEDGQKGLRGQKGERGAQGICPAVCGDPRKTRTTTLTTTPEPKTTTTPSTTSTTTTPTTTPVPTLPPREKTCSIRMIGKPYYKRNSGHMYGAWIRDAAPPKGVNKRLQWNTYGSKGTLLYQFSNERAMAQNSTNGLYNLQPMAFQGTGHVVYNHSLYYQEAGTWKLVRYDLRQRAVTSVNFLHHRGARYYGNEKLYSNVPGAVDFAVDQSGLWVIYANHKDPAGREAMGYASWANDDVFFLAKLDPVLMDQLKVFQLSVPMAFRGNGFMVCGTLYLVRDSTRSRTTIAWAFDAFTEKQATLRIAFTNPYGNMAQLSYDPRTNKILGWDSGRLILYPLLLWDRPL